MMNERFNCFINRITKKKRLVPEIDLNEHISKVRNKIQGARGEAQGAGFRSNGRGAR